MIVSDGLFRGLADSKWAGVKGSFYTSVGIDGHSTPGLLKVQQALAKDSGTTVTALCWHALAASTGATIWFSYTDGKIWERSTGGTWTLVYTTAPAAGNAGCLGVAEYNGYIYWATQSRLHRIAVSGIGSAANWTTNAVPNWKTFTKTDSEFHPMAVQSSKLFIGDGNLVAKVISDDTFTASSLDLLPPYRIKTMAVYDIDLVIGTIIASTVNHCRIYRWDTVSTSYNTSDFIEENGINAFIHDENFLYVQVGQYGRIYFYNGQHLIPYKRIPGDWSPTKYAEIRPGSVSTLLTIPVFGLSNLAGNPVNQGVYSFGSYSKDYPKVLDLSFPISSGSLTSIEIGAVLAVGADLFVAWKDGSTYGVDKLDYSAKYTSAYFETMVLTQAETRSFIKTLSLIFANYETLPTNTDITFSYKKAHDTSYTAMTSLTDTNLKQVRAELSVPDGAAWQFKIAFTVSGNTAPTIESVGYFDNVKEK